MFFFSYNKVKTSSGNFQIYFQLFFLDPLRTFTPPIYEIHVSLEIWCLLNIIYSSYLMLICSLAWIRTTDILNVNQTP